MDFYQSDNELKSLEKRGSFAQQLHNQQRTFYDPHSYQLDAVKQAAIMAC